MDYYKKYIKYKSKYLQIKNNQNGGTQNADISYQDILYEIAKYIKPNMAQKFKTELGMKQLSNQVIELNKITYISELQKDITNYFITDKIDGKRTILYLTNNKSYAVNDVLNTLDIQTKDVCILDTEYYEDNYYIFDIMVYEGNSIVNIPFEERIKYFEKFRGLPNIKIKSFIKLTADFKDQIKKFKKEKKPYDVDGIILTPAKGNYKSMKVFKYKPPEQLTIDFLMKKCPDNLKKLYNNKNNKTLYILFCSIYKRVFFKLRLRTIKYYNEMFKDIDPKNLPQFFPIQFEPSSNKQAFLFWSDKKDLDNEVGEFLYDIENQEWHLKKIREDRRIEVKRGNYFGNNYKIAELIWMARHDPLIIENMDNTSKNFNINKIQKSIINYINFVKSEIFGKYKGTEWLMDLNAGNGDDLINYSMYNIKNSIFLEKDITALTELVIKKHNFTADEKNRNNMNILIQNVDLLDDYHDNIKLINNVYRGQYIDVIICNFALQKHFKNMKSLENICKLINHYLKKNGKFIFTSFNAQKVIDILKDNNGELIENVDDKIKYSISKKYEKNDLFSIGQKIKVSSLHTDNIYQDEYLINIKTIESELSKYNIVLDVNKSFSHYLDKYNGSLDDSDKTYINLLDYYIFIKN